MIIGAKINKSDFWEFLVVQWLALILIAEGTGSIPGRGTKIAGATWNSQKRKR